MPQIRRVKRRKMYNKINDLHENVKEMMLKGFSKVRTPFAF